jgi:hypothetical protein
MITLGSRVKDWTCQRLEWERISGDQYPHHVPICGLSLSLDEAIPKDQGRIPRESLRMVRGSNQQLHRNLTSPSNKRRKEMTRFMIKHRFGITLGTLAVGMILLAILLATQLIHEDSAFWNCLLMGNHQCGDANHVVGFIRGR